MFRKEQRKTKVDEARSAADLALAKWQNDGRHNALSFPANELPQEKEARAVYWWDRALTAEERLMWTAVSHGALVGALIYIGSRIIGL